MADILPEFEDEDEAMLDGVQAYLIADKIVEACDRLRPIHAITPGAEAVARICLDDVWYRIGIRVEDRNGEDA